MSTATVTAPHHPAGLDKAAQRHRVTPGRVLVSEWIKLRSLRSTVYFLLAAIVMTIGPGMLFAAMMANRWAQLDPAERAHFDPAGVSLRGVFLAQLAIGVLGVLLISGEYSTGMIRATLSAVPRRLPVLWAKAGVFTVVAAVLMIARAISDAAWSALRTMLEYKTRWYGRRLADSNACGGPVRPQPRKRGRRGPVKQELSQATAGIPVL